MKFSTITRDVRDVAETLREALSIEKNLNPVDRNSLSVNIKERSMRRISLSFTRTFAHDTRVADYEREGPPVILTRKRVEINSVSYHVYYRNCNTSFSILVFSIINKIYFV